MMVATEQPKCLMLCTRLPVGVIGLLQEICFVSAPGVGRVCSGGLAGGVGGEFLDTEYINCTVNRGWAYLCVCVELMICRGEK